MGLWLPYKTKCGIIAMLLARKQRSYARKLRWDQGTCCTTYRKINSSRGMSITIWMRLNHLQKIRNKIFTSDYFKYHASILHYLQNLIMITRTARMCFRMCQITPHIYDNLFKEFGKTMSLSTLGKFYKSENLVQVYNIIKHTKMQPQLKISLYNQVESQICAGNTDMELNILANIYKEKSVLFEHHAQSAEAILQIEKAVKAIQSMEHPFSLEVASILQNAGNMHLRYKNYPKAQKFLKDAEHTLNLAEQDLLENTGMSLELKEEQVKQINFLMAKVMSQFCLIHMHLAHPFESRQYLDKALERWKKIDDKNNMAYLMTIKFKCILHFWMKEEELGIQTAQQYLSAYQPTQETIGHRMWFMKTLIDKGIDTYSNQLKTNIEELSKVLPEKELTDFLLKIGVIKKSTEKPAEKPVEKPKDGK